MLLVLHLQNLLSTYLLLLINLEHHIVSLLQAWGDRCHPLAASWQARRYCWRNIFGWSRLPITHGSSPGGPNSGSTSGPSGRCPCRSGGGHFSGKTSNGSHSVGIPGRTSSRASPFVGWSCRCPRRWNHRWVISPLISVTVLYHHFHILHHVVKIDFSFCLLNNSHQLVGPAHHRNRSICHRHWYPGRGVCSSLT